MRLFRKKIFTSNEIEVFQIIAKGYRWFYVKLDIQEMENNVVVRTISKKYSKKDWRPF